MTYTYSIARALLALSLGSAAIAQSDLTLSPSQFNAQINCDEHGSVFCIDRYTHVNYEGEYIGHDEPSVIFYSSIPGSGNQSIYTIILPKDPPTPPKQDGSGGTWNFQLHPTFWLGMAMCDTQSAPVPNANGTCVPDSDSNIANNTNPNAPDYMGKHAGTAFMEMQFYPPGWIGSPQILSPTQYTAALNIDSFSFNMNTGQNNNRDCLNRVGQEPVNFATITKNGVPLFPANPLGVAFGTSSPNINNVLLMNPGDTLRVTLQDTAGGFMVLIQDLTTGQSGSMVANPQAGFGQVHWNPAAAACTVDPYTFHPMYSTSSPNTRVPWAAHSYNVAFSDEIGHFELCNAFNNNPNSPNYLTCTVPGPQDVKLDADDAPCANPAAFGIPSPPFQNIIGCVGADSDFDGQSYGFNWPGASANPADTLRDPLLRPTPILFTSPRFQGPSGALLNYDSIAFEVNMPVIESNCDATTGLGCVNPPAGAQFYPIYTTTNLSAHQCYWQFGGANISGTLDTFGGTSTAEYGPLLSLAYPTARGPVFSYTNFRQILGGNPCQTLP
jgi:hypothetical protein